MNAIGAQDTIPDAFTTSRIYVCHTPCSEYIRHRDWRGLRISIVARIQDQDGMASCAVCGKNVRSHPVDDTSLVDLRVAREIVHRNFGVNYRSEAFDVLSRLIDEVATIRAYGRYERKFREQDRARLDAVVQMERERTAHEHLAAQAANERAAEYERKATAAKAEASRLRAEMRRTDETVIEATLDSVRRIEAAMAAAGKKRKKRKKVKP